MKRAPEVLLALTVAATLVPAGTASSQTTHYPFESVRGLRLHNVTAEPATHQGKKGLRVTIAEERSPSGLGRGPWLTSGI